MKTVNNLTFQQLFQKYFVTSSLQNQVPLIYNSEMNKDRLLMHCVKITPSLSIGQSAKYEFINQLYKYQTNLTCQRSIDQKFASAKPTETEERVIDEFKEIGRAHV